MATHIGIGFSKNPDIYEAINEATQQVKKTLNQERIDSAILFHTTHYDPEVFLPLIYEKLDQTKIVGSSTAGIIFEDKIELRGIGILAMTSDTIKVESSHVNNLNLQYMGEAGKNLVKTTFSGLGQQHRKLFIFFTDGLLNNLSELIGGIKEQVGNYLPIIGIGSSDDFQFKKTYQYYHNKIMSESAASILFGGHLNIGISCKHGLRPLGKPRIVDKAKGQIIQSIDGKKAFDIYKEYFGDEVKALNKNRLDHINIRYPLGIPLDDENEYLLRNVISSLEDGSLVCQDNIETDSEVHIMIGNKESYLRAAQIAATEVKDQLNGEKPKFILIFESLIRYKLLGRAAIQEIQIIRETFDNSVPVIGMYSYGHFFSFVTADNKLETKFQNESITIIAVS